jgi:O-succinylbenzoic acid--CoA ligase
MGPTALIHALPKRRERHFGDRVVWCFRDRVTTIHAGFARAAAEYRDQTALVFGSSSWTYGELESEVGRIAHGLKALGVAPGDRVAMLIRNRAEFVMVFYAAQRLGAVCVPMDVRLQGAEVAHVLATSGARILVHDENLTDRLPAMQGETAGARTVAIPEAGTLFPQSRATDTAPPFEGAGEEDIALILYTSGTTGQPKGASIAHFNVAHSVIHHSGNLGLNHTDRCLVAVPISHITGLLCGVIAPLFAGGTLIVLPYFKAGEFVAAAAEACMTYTIMVPAMYNLCLRVPDFDTYDLSSWRLGHFGGSPMPEATIDTLAQKLPNLTLVNGYGATETCSPAVMMPVGEGPAPHGAIGKSLPCVEIVIMDPETGVEVPKGTSGEIWVRGPMVIASYWNNPEATAKGIVGGFWRSGDIGKIDEQGYVYVLDRLKDMINRGGYKIYSAEVESILAHYPGVVEAAIVGKPDPVLGERVHAFVCHSAPISEDELRAFCASRLADYKIPESWTLSTELLPRSATGKLAKKLLHDRLNPK